MADTAAMLVAYEAEITRLRAALADAQAVGFASGVEAAAKRCDAIAGNTADFNHYHRRAAGQCGAAIRALTPPDATAAAARVLLADEKTVHKLCSELVKLVEAEEYAGTFEEWAESDQDEMVGFMQKALRALITEKGASAA